jgi:REP element-mobilizing transposase RayT
MHAGWTKRDALDIHDKMLYQQDMARAPRLHAPGVLYHVIARGNNAQIIFADDADYRRFIDGMVRALPRCDCAVMCYALMPNHVHVLLESGAAPVSRFLQPLLTAYSVYFNRRNLRTGHVFHGRYKAIICEKALYALELVRYIHLNPVRAGLVATPDDWPWTSHGEILGRWKRGVLTPQTMRSLLVDGFGGVRAYRRFMADDAGRLQYREDFHPAGPVPLLGTDQFIRSLSVERPCGRRVRATDAQLLDLAAATAREAGISFEMLHGELRIRTVTKARRRFITAAVKKLGCSQSRIAAVLGCDQSYVSRVVAAESHNINAAHNG